MAEQQTTAICCSEMRAAKRLEEYDRKGSERKSLDPGLRGDLCHTHEDLRDAQTRDDGRKLRRAAAAQRSECDEVDDNVDQTSGNGGKGNGDQQRCVQRRDGVQPGECPHHKNRAMG